MGLSIEYANDDEATSQRPQIAGENLIFQVKF